MTVKKNTGEKNSFKKSWKTREETYYNHWVKGEPRNQIQLAFRNHWEIFNLLMKNKLFNKGKRCLEVGCGRGTISAYYIDNGYNYTLLDISSHVIEFAKEIFKKNNFKADFTVGDANRMPYKDNSFDIVFSLGLLEHFEDAETPIREQIRVLDKGGLFIGYIVPKYFHNVQKEYLWINEILKVYKKEKSDFIPKEELFRSDSGSIFYNKILKRCKLKGIKSSGIYPLPMISHSIEFPFSLMPEEAEKEIIKHFKFMLKSRFQKDKKHPWLCEEDYGQALLIWGFK
jgi:ubiquinone/menaquinone biosynthesis C-methylase UbiE